MASLRQKGSDGITIVVFARVPERGRVKTRLAASLGNDAALAIYRRLGEHTRDVACDVARRLPGVRVAVHYTPASGARSMSSWLGGDLTYRSQSAGDLGMRMSHAVNAELASGATGVVIIGTDCPGLTPTHLERAIAALAAAHADVVIGPATDGGYWSIGMRRRHDELFGGIAWSAANTLDLTLATAGAADLSVELLDVLDDVDTAEDWRRLRHLMAPHADH